MKSVNFTADLNRLTPRDLVRKHIMDRNHIVTEEEFNRLKIGVDAENDKMINMQTTFLRSRLLNQTLPS